MKKVFAILSFSIGSTVFAQERTVLVHYNSHNAKVIEQKLIDKKVQEKILATIEADTLFVYDKSDKVLALLNKQRHPKYSAIKNVLEDNPKKIIAKETVEKLP